jgi:limonene-1,2-epoxide hydrolase
MQLAGVAVQSDAADIAVNEKTNLGIVDKFMKGWAASDATGAKQASFFSDDCIVRLQEGKPPIRGMPALIAAFDGYLSKGARFDIKITSSCAKGPVVINSRTDGAIINGRATKGSAVIGFFLLRGGKIVEQSDFLP